ncbi:hypothetical protein A2U01_0097654, partial [Trifolium medium]|nr:hypothetical protein [Trifolium medium]
IENSGEISCVRWLSSGAVIYLNRLCRPRGGGVGQRCCSC